jgi:trehalose-6-phosphate synthase
MVTSQLDFPVWKTKENIKVKQNTEIEYKYIIFKKGKFDRWESLTQNSNRIINVRNNVRIVIHDIEGISTSRIEKYTKLNFSIDTGSEVNIMKFEEEEEQNYFGRDSKPKKSYYYEKNLDFLLNYDDHKQRKTINIIDNHTDEEEKYLDLNYESEEEDDFITDKNVKEEREVKPDDKIIMGVLYLPMIAIKNEKGDWELALTNDPFFHNIFKILEGRNNVIWVGLLKNYSQITNENARDSLISTLQKKYNMYAIKIEKTLESRLRKFIYGVLDPLFHYINILNNMKQILEFEDLWKAYKEFNELVSKSILTHIIENTLVFLNDYHLLLTPSFLYNAHHHFNSKIYNNILLGLYVNSPFPSHDVFRMFPFREELLKSMMNCSLIGFHTFDSSRNFLTSCKRILFIQYESNKKGDLALSYYGRNVIVRVKHVSSEQTMIQKEMKKEIFEKEFNQIKERHQNQFIHVSVDNLLFLHGIKHKIEAYKRFLREIGDSNARQIAFVIYINSTKEDNIEIEEDFSFVNLLDQILEMSKSIKKEFGDEVIDVVVKNISYIERLAVLASGNCLVKICKRETFSLDIYEFLNLKILMKDTDKISYILSENSGVTTSLSGGVKVHTFDVNI